MFTSEWPRHTHAHPRKPPIQAPHLFLPACVVSPFSLAGLLFSGPIQDRASPYRLARVEAALDAISQFGSWLRFANKIQLQAERQTQCFLFLLLSLPRKIPIYRSNWDGWLCPCDRLGLTLRRISCWCSLRWEERRIWCTDGIVSSLVQLTTRQYNQKQQLNFKTTGNTHNEFPKEKLSCGKLLWGQPHPEPQNS